MATHAPIADSVRDDLKRLGRRLDPYKPVLASSLLRFAGLALGTVACRRGSVG